jgi:acyl-CoA thioesterase
VDFVQFFNDGDKFARHCGAVLLEAGNGCSKAKMKIEPYHMNGLGIVQGGAVFTLADFAFAAACNSHETAAVALNVSITFIKATRTGELTAIAEEASLNPKVGTYVIRVTDDRGDLVALFNGLAYRTKETLREMQGKMK